jgi:YcxB-like protein
MNGQPYNNLAGSDWRNWLIAMYSRVLIDTYSYILYYGSRQFTVIPKRVFQSFEQQQAFEDLLTQHVFEIVRRDT